MAFITGSSHLTLGQSATPFHVKGIFGSYTDAVVPGQYTVEAGQVSTGSVVKWFRDHFCGKEAQEAARRGVNTYKVLNEQAREIPIGADGLIVLDYWQGNRSPYIDPEARGDHAGLFPPPHQRPTSPAPCWRASPMARSTSCAFFVPTAMWSIDGGLPVGPPTAASGCRSMPT